MRRRIDVKVGGSILAAVLFALPLQSYGAGIDIRKGELTCQAWKTFSNETHKAAWVVGYQSGVIAAGWDSAVVLMVILAEFKIKLEKSKPEEFRRIDEYSEAVFKELGRDLDEIRFSGHRVGSIILELDVACRDSKNEKKALSEVMRDMAKEIKRRLR